MQLVGQHLQREPVIPALPVFCGERGSASQHVVPVERKIRQIRPHLNLKWCQGD